MIFFLKVSFFDWAQMGAGASARGGGALAESLQDIEDRDVRGLLAEAEQISKKFGYGIQLLTWIRKHRDFLENGEFAALLGCSTPPSSTSSRASRAMHVLESEVGHFLWWSVQLGDGGLFVCVFAFSSRQSCSVSTFL